MHLDGSSLKLSPFETEMRLRLWWHLCVLESRAPEDQGFQPAVDVTNPKLRLPLNIDDNQIYPDMTRLPVESDEWTQMSFFLVQTESCRLLHPILDSQEQRPADPLLPIAEKRKTLQERSQYLSANYSEAPTHLSRITLQHRKTAYKKMVFVLQLREEISMRQQKGTKDDAAPDVLQPSFQLACDGLESSRGLLMGDFASRFRWLFRLYTPWYALAYILRCLCTKPCGAEAERAWALVDELYPVAMGLHGQWEGSQGDRYGHGSIWRCLDLLRRQAISARQHAQLHVATADAEAEPSSAGGKAASKPFPETESGRTAMAYEPSMLWPEPDQGLNTDPSESLFPSLDLSMPDFTLLPDWNAVINGDLAYDNNEMDISYFPAT